MEDKIIRFCNRCGREYPILGRVLKWGEYYPGFTVKKEGEIKEYPEDREIKEAICRDCAKELYDKRFLSEEIWRDDLIKKIDDSPDIELNYPIAFATVSEIKKIIKDLYK